MKLSDFFKKHFREGFKISSNCKIINMYMYYSPYTTYENENVIIEIEINNQKIKYLCDYYLNKYQEVKLHKVIEIDKNFYHKSEFKITEITNDSKIKIYNIINAWKNYNRYLKNINNLNFKNEVIF